MQLNSLMNDGQVQAYYSDAANAEVTYQTSGIGADVSGGGVRINMIPKEGGNRISGSVVRRRHQRQAGRATTSARSCKARGLASRRARSITSRTTTSRIGGPIKQDKLWYFTTVRRIATNELVAQQLLQETAEQGMEDQWIYNLLVRLTWQMTPKNKLTAYYDRYPKFKGHEMGALTDPETAARAARLAARASTTPAQVEGHVDDHQPAAPRGGLLDQRRVPLHRLSARHPEGARIAGVVHADRHIEAARRRRHPSTLSTATGTAARRRPTASIPKKYVISTSLSYVTGIAQPQGRRSSGASAATSLEYDINGDLVQLYRNGAPD